MNNILETIVKIIKEVLLRNNFILLETSTRRKNAVYFRYLYSQILSDFGLTDVEIGEIIGKDRTTIRHYLTTYKETLEYTNYNSWKFTNQIISEVKNEISKISEYQLLENKGFTNDKT